MTTYKNRYNDIFIFSQDDEGNILWEGNFEFCRIGFPNDYSKAYAEYLRDGGNMEMEEFQDVVHQYDEDKKQYVLGLKYPSMVESIKNQIDMVDPSGGPYISKGMSLESFGYPKYIVQGFKIINTGYKIITEKCIYCELPGDKHKMSCKTQKTTIYYNQN
jgi:hypothetical protein